MNWTQKEMEEIYQKVQHLVATDEEFRTELLADSKKAIEKLSGKELPEGFKIKVIENDPAYQATFVLPDFVGDEVEDELLDDVAGGLALVLVVSACGAAVTLTGNICGAAVGK